MKTPNSIDAEKSVLGGVFCDREAMAAIRTAVSPDDFYNHAHGVIYDAMVSLYDKRVPVDLVTLKDWLNESGKLQSIGGASYLCELSDNCPSAAAIVYHAKIVKDKARLRRIIENARQIAIKAGEAGVKPEDIPTSLSVDISQDASVSMITEEIRVLNRNIDEGYHGLPACYDLLSRTIRRMTPGHLWIVGAYTSTGKSAFLVDLVCRLFKTASLENPGVAIFSTEMSCEQYLLRILSNYTGIPTWAITEKKTTPQQAEALVQAQIFLSTKNLYLYDRLYKIEDIERTARLLKSRGLDVMAIDYLQNTWGDGSIYERMSKLAPVLQCLAKDLQITIIGLSQVSNQHQREKGASGVYGYKGAGEIAAAADLTIDLERDKADEELVMFSVSKNRHGRKGTGALRYVSGFTRMKEIVEDENGG